MTRTVNAYEVLPTGCYANRHSLEPIFPGEKTSPADHVINPIQIEVDGMTGYASVCSHTDVDAENQIVGIYYLPESEFSDELEGEDEEFMNKVIAAVLGI